MFQAFLRMMLGENRLFCSYDSEASFQILKYLLFGGKGRDEEEAERLQNMKYVSFSFQKKLLDQNLSTETQILEDRILGRYIGQSGKCPSSVYVKLDPEISRDIM